MSIGLELRAPALQVMKGRAWTSATYEETGMGMSAG
jgi:hypothetical protein